MTDRLEYGTTAKVLHWVIAALLLVQYLIGWLMPDIHRGQQPGTAMTLHVSIGMLILILIVLRLASRRTPPPGPGGFAPAGAAGEFGSGALAALRAGARHDHYRMAVRLVSRLVDILLLSGAAANAGFRQCASRKGDGN